MNHIYKNKKKLVCGHKQLTTSFRPESLFTLNQLGMPDPRVDSRLIKLKMNRLLQPNSNLGPEVWSTLPHSITTNNTKLKYLDNHREHYMQNKGWCDKIRKLIFKISPYLTATCKTHCIEPILPTSLISRRRTAEIAERNQTSGIVSGKQNSQKFEM